MKTALDVLAHRVEAVQANKAEREAKAQRNRERAPFTAARMDDLRQFFGNDIEAIYINEGGAVVDRRPVGPVVSARDMVMEWKG